LSDDLSGADFGVGERDLPVSFLCDGSVDGSAGIEIGVQATKSQLATRLGKFESKDGLGGLASTDEGLEDGRSVVVTNALESHPHESVCRETRALETTTILRSSAQSLFGGSQSGNLDRIRELVSRDRGAIAIGQRKGLAESFGSRRGRRVVFGVSTAGSAAGRGGKEQVATSSVEIDSVGDRRSSDGNGTWRPAKSQFNVFPRRQDEWVATNTKTTERRIKKQGESKDDGGRDGRRE
jgi:hypothetical protein